MPADPLSAAPGRRRSFQWTRYPSKPYLPIPVIREIKILLTADG